MTNARTALWLGPIGCGKSTLVARSLPRGFEVIDQDAELEDQARAAGLPLDARRRDAAQAAAFTVLRKAVTDRTWSRVPQLRIEGTPIAYETPGDKPHLLARELELDRAAGYRTFGIAMPFPAAVCLDRNRARPRVVPEEVVQRTAEAFERNLRQGVYTRLFGAAAFVVVEDAERFSIGEWVAGLLGC